MRFYIISAIVLIPLLALLSLLAPLVTGAAERPIGPAAAATASGPGDAARGEALYRSKCYGCHAPEAGVGPGYDTADFQLTYASDETIAAVVRAGRSPMPAFTEEMLSERELLDLLAYLRSLPAPQEYRALVSITYCTNCKVLAKSAGSAGVRTELDGSGRPSHERSISPAHAGSRTVLAHSAPARLEPTRPVWRLCSMRQ
ncbi:MAG: cytochrome c [Chloroflexi bacterium]|nr:cytochrome c [Chloroflexota bacterium]